MDDPTSATQDGFSDHSIYALAKTITSNESSGEGGYDANNADTGAQGAYQFTQPFLQQYAPKYLKNYVPGQQLSPQDQDKLADGVLTERAKEGYSIPQQLSAWYAGDAEKDAYLDPSYSGGVGKKTGTKYPSVADYVQKGLANYQKYASQMKLDVSGGLHANSDESQAQPASGNSFDDLLSTAGGIISSAGGWLLKNGRTALNIGLPVAGAGIAEALTGGADTPFVPEEIAGGEAALQAAEGMSSATSAGADEAISGETAAESGAAKEAASTATKPGLLSKAGSLLKKAVVGGTGASIGGAAAAGIEGALGMNNASAGGGGQSSGSPDQTAQGAAFDNLLSQSTGNTKRIADTYQEALLNSDKNGRMFTMTPEGQDAIKTAAVFGLPPQMVGGAMNMNPSMQKADSLVGGLNESVQKVLDTEDTKGSYDEVKARAKSSLRERLPQHEWAAAEKEIDGLVSAYSGGRGEGNIGEFHKMKMGTSHGRKFGEMERPLKKEALKAIAHASKKEVLGKSKNSPLYKEAMKMEERLINSKKMMKLLHGKKGVHHQSFTKDVFKALGNAAGAYVGDKIGGPFGAVLGYLVESKLAKATDKKFGHTIFDTPGMKKALLGLKGKSPMAYKVLEEKMKQAFASQAKPPSDSTTPQGKSGLLPQSAKQKRTAPSRPKKR